MLRGQFEYQCGKVAGFKVHCFEIIFKEKGNNEVFYSSAKSEEGI